MNTFASLMNSKKYLKPLALSESHYKHFTKRLRLYIKYFPELYTIYMMKTFHSKVCGL